MKKSMITDQRGMGLVPFLVSAFVIGIILAGMSSSVLTMLRSQISVAASAEAALLSEQLQATLSNEGACANALQGVNPASGGALNNIPIRIGDQDALLSENADLPAGQGFKLVHFRTAIDDAPFVGAGGVVTNGVPIFKDGADDVRSHRIKVTLQLKKTSEGIFAPLSQKKEFFIDANVKVADGTIKSCASRSVASQSCFQMGGVWNTSIENDIVTGQPIDGNRCMSNQHCQYGGSYSDPATPAAGRFPNSFMSPPAYSCPQGFNRKQTGAVSLANAVGKAQIQTTVAPIYSCLRCVQTDKAAIVAGATNLANTAANSLINDALVEGDTFLNLSNSVLTGACLSALSTSGDWIVNYSSSDCGPVPSAPSGTCDPRNTPRADSLDCGYMDYSDPFDPFYVNLTSAYTATCPQVRSIPAYCKTF